MADMVNETTLDVPQAVALHLGSLKAGGALKAGIARERLPLVCEHSEREGSVWLEL